MSRLIVLAALAAACEGVVTTPVEVVPPEQPFAIIEGAPSDAPLAAVTVLDAGEVLALGTLRGAAVAGTRSGVFAPGAGTLKAVGEDGRPSATGPVTALAAREGGRLLAVAEGGLFHDDEQGELVPSPLGRSVAGLEVLGLDVVGAADAEVAWLNTRSGAYRVGEGALTRIGFDDALRPEVVLAAGPRSALIAADGVAYLLELDAATATRLADGLGTVRGADRAPDGTLYLATQAGLLSVTRDGAVALRTLAAKGEARGVEAVSARTGTVTVASAGQLVQLDEGFGHTVATIGDGPLAGLTVDGAGDTWLSREGRLERAATGVPVSFAADVRPFFAQHCDSCHPVAGSSVDLRSFESSKANAALIMRRLNGTGGLARMPPKSTWTTSDYALVLRWASSELLP